MWIAPKNGYAIVFGQLNLSFSFVVRNICMIDYFWKSNYFPHIWAKYGIYENSFIHLILALFNCLKLLQTFPKKAGLRDISCTALKKTKLPEVAYRNLRYTESVSDPLRYGRHRLHAALDVTERDQDSKIVSK